MIYFVALTIALFLPLNLDPLADQLSHFPNRYACRKALATNRGFQEYLAGIRAVRLELYWTIAQAEAECRAAWRAWDALGDARSIGCALEHRQDAMLALLELLGPDDYGWGRMPCPIPVAYQWEDR